MPAEGNGRQNERRSAELLGILIDPLDVIREVVGQRQLLEQADQEERLMCQRDQNSPKPVAR